MQPTTTIERETMAAPLLNEFRSEAATTRRVLERIPQDKLSWKPHAKSMSLGQLAWHVATVPGAIARITQLDTFDVTQANFEPPQPKNMQEVMTAYDQSVLDAEAYLSGMTDQKAQAGWRMMRGDRELSVTPRIGVVRTIMLNHWYHHRGQLSVYLRMLDVPVPVIYGRSADENPFG